MTDPTTEPGGQEVAQRPARTPVPLGLRVDNLDTAYRVSKYLADSSLVPRALQGKPGDCLMVVMYGAELGLSIFQSVQGLAPINGRLTMSVDLRVGLTRERKGYLTGVACGHLLSGPDEPPVRCGELAGSAVHFRHGAAGHHPYVEDHDDTRCRYRVENPRTGEVWFGEFTVDDALRAGLLTRDDNGDLVARSDYGKPLPWQLYRRDLLLARAATRACRRAAPEVGFGLYTEEEVEQMPLEAEVVERPHPAEPEPTTTVEEDAAALREMDQAAQGGA
jgi:hypothetical protein